MVYIVITKDSSCWGSYQDPQTLQLLPGIITIKECLSCAKEYMTPARLLLSYNLSTGEISQLTP